MKKALSFLLLVTACGTPDTVDVEADVQPLVTVPSMTWITLGFDDGRASQATVLDDLRARQLRGTFYLNSDRLGASGYLTAAQVAGIAADGHEIASHTIGHANLVGRTYDEDVALIGGDRDALRQAGYPVVSFAFPYGANDATSERAAASLLDSARDIGGIAVPGECSGCPYADTLPPRDLFAIRSPSSESNCPTAQSLKDKVDRAVAAGGWLHLVFHNFTETDAGCGTYVVKHSDFTALLDYLAEKQTAGDLLVMPQHAIVGVTNPSFERVDAAGNSDCWEHVAYLNNEGSFKRATFGHSGGAAEQIELTSLTDGNRKLLVDRARPECVIPAAAGHRYRLSAWYQHKRYDTSTYSKVRFIIYTKSATTGKWTMLDDSGSFPSTSSWKQMAWDTPAIPATASAVSVGFYLKSLGLTTIDDFMMTDLGTTPAP